MRMLLLALTPMCLVAGDDVYRATSPEPTPAETLILELMNRFRADPSAEAEWIVKTYGSGDKVMGADAKMFLAECKKLTSQPPLVFNLALLDAARKHSYYMTFNGLGHEEEKGKRGFTGVKFTDRCKAAGYTGFPAGENAFAGSKGPLNSHVGFIVDFGPGGPGGMQPGRGHRMNMIGKHKEVGPGGVPNGKGSDGLSVTHNFGSGSAPRYAGGVVYVDSNGNGFYDIGEGRGNVPIIASDGSRVTTWSSGAYTLVMRGAAAVKIKADYYGHEITKNYVGGSDNIGFSFAIPAHVESDAANRLLVAVESQSDDSTGRFKAQVALAMAVPSMQLDADLMAKVTAAVGSVAGDLHAAQEKIRAGFNQSSAEMKKLLSAEQRTWRGTAAATWFKEAETTWRVETAVASYLKQASQSKPSASVQRNMRKQLQMAKDATTVAEFASRYSVLLQQIGEV